MRKDLKAVDFIQSARNARVKEWRKLLSKKGRDRTGTYLLEGFHLVEEAMRAKADIVEIIIVEDTEIPSDWDLAAFPEIEVAEEIGKAISETETAQGIFAVCRKQALDSAPSKHQKFLLLDSVQDPGNIGTMIRTAEAAGIDAVILGEGTGDLYNPKVIRSAQGSHFHIHIETGNLSEWIDKLKEQNIHVYGTALENAVPFKDVSASDSFAVLVGNEGQGCHLNC